MGKAAYRAAAYLLDQPSFAARFPLKHAEKIAPAFAHRGSVGIEKAEARVIDTAQRKRAQDEAPSESGAFEHIEHAERFRARRRLGKFGPQPVSRQIKEEWAS